MSQRRRFTLWVDYERRRFHVTPRVTLHGPTQLLSALLLVSYAIPGFAADTQVLVCGAPVTRHLSAAAIDHYNLAASVGTPVALDVTDTGPTPSLLKLHSFQTETCSGNLISNAGLPFDVSDCLGNDETDYTVVFNITGNVAENCGTTLACGPPAEGTELSVPGEVDSYRLPVLERQHITLSVAREDAAAGALRLRVFGPAEAPLFDTCSGSVTWDVTDNDTLTVLVSACTTPLTGPYKISWNTPQPCSASADMGFAYVTFNTPPAIAVVDLGANKVVSFLPPQGIDRDAPEVAGRVVTTPNNAFVYATFVHTGSVMVINSTLNRAVATLQIPLGTYVNQLRFAFSPDSRFAYAATDALFSDEDLSGAVEVINAETRKLEAVIRIGRVYDEAPIAASPDGKFIYVASWDHEYDVAVIDTASRSVVAHISKGPDTEILSRIIDISFSTDSKTAYITLPYLMLIVDVATHRIVNEVLLPGSIEGIAFTADRRTAYAMNVNSNELEVIDVAAQAIRDPVQFEPAFRGYEFRGGVALSADESRILVTVSDRRAFLISVDTSTLQIVGVLSPPAGYEIASDITVANPPPGLCMGDDLGRSRVTVGELITSLNYSVDGCPNLKPNADSASKSQ